jgi:hypothetical protein
MVVQSSVVCCALCKLAAAQLLTCERCPHDTMLAQLLTALASAWVWLASRLQCAGVLKSWSRDTCEVWQLLGAMCVNKSGAWCRCCGGSTATTGSCCSLQAGCCSVVYTAS